MKSKVFVSCGQHTEEERRLATNMAALLQSLGFQPYVAIDVQSVFEINSQVLRHLKDSDCYILINLRRELLKESRYAGSLFSHQEFAIAYALGFENIIVVSQVGAPQEGMLSCVASNTDTFEQIDDCIAIVAKAIQRAGWSNSYSRRLSAENLRFEPNLIQFGEFVGYFLYLDIHNRRPDIAALETTGRLSAYALAGETFRPSPIRSPLKATGKRGYSHTVFPNSYQAFDLLCVGWLNPPRNPSQVPYATSGPTPQIAEYAELNSETRTVYLNTSLDLRPMPDIPLFPGQWHLKFEFFAIGFPLLEIVIQLTIARDTLPEAILID